MKKIYIIAAVALVFSACHKNHENAGQEVPAVEVATPMVDSVTLHKQYPGYIRAMDRVDIVARVNGQLLQQFYKEGDYVNKGQLLFTIEPSKYNDAVQQAQAALKTAQSQYDYASRQYEAMKKALEADAVSQMDVIQAESSLNTARASIQNAKAALATAQENLGYCTIRATRSGRISIGTMSTGNYVNGEGAPVKLATIYDDTRVKAVFEIEASQYEQMIGEGNPAETKLLQSIPLKFESPLPHNYTANLVYISPNVQTNTGTIALEGHLDNPDRELKDGMYVSIDLPYGTRKDAVLIRDASIGTDQLGKYVYLVNDSDKVVYTPVEVGQLYNDTLRIITKGVSPKDRYVTKALLTVRNGMEVKPVKR